MDESTFIMLIPPNPLPGGRIELMKVNEFLDMMSGMICGVNTTSGIELPVPRNSTTTERDIPASPPKCHKLTLEGYKEMRRRKSTDVSSDVENSFAGTDESRVSDVREQMEYLQCHLKRLKNLMKSISGDESAQSLSKLIILTGRYVDHISQLNEKFTTEVSSYVMAQDKMVMATVFENESLWHLTSNPERIIRREVMQNSSPSQGIDRSVSGSKFASKWPLSQQENASKRLSDLPTRIVSPNVRGVDEDRRSSAKRRRLEVESSSSKTANNTYVRSPGHSRTPPNAYSKDNSNISPRPERPNTSNALSRRKSSTYRNSLSSTSKSYSPQHSKSLTDSRHSSKSPRRYSSSSREKSPTPKFPSVCIVKNAQSKIRHPKQRISHMGNKPRALSPSTEHRSSSKSPRPSGPTPFFVPREVTPPETSSSKPIPSPNHKSKTAKPKHNPPLPSTPNLHKHQKHDAEESRTGSATSMVVSEPPQQTLSYPVISHRKIYPKTSTLKDSPIVTSPVESPEKPPTKPPRSQPVAAESPQSPPSSPHPTTFTANDPQNSLPASSFPPSQTPLSPIQAPHRLFSPNPVSPGPSQKRVSVKHRLDPLFRRQQYRPKYNMPLSRISTQITTRYDRTNEAFPFSHAMQEDDMSRNTDRYYPPNMAGYLTKTRDYYLGRYNEGRQADWSHGYLKY